MELNEIIIDVKTSISLLCLTIIQIKNRYKKNYRLMNIKIKRFCFVISKIYLFDKICKIKIPIHQGTYLKSSEKNNFQKLATLIQNSKILFFQRLVIPFTDLMGHFLIYYSLSPFITLQPELANDRRW